MSVWSRIRWINVARAAAGVTALLLVIAWPRLAAPPPAVPDGAPVPLGTAPEAHAAPGGPVGPDRFQGSTAGEDGRALAPGGGDRSPARASSDQALPGRPDDGALHRRRAAAGRRAGPRRGARRNGAATRRDSRAKRPAATTGGSPATPAVAPAPHASPVPPPPTARTAVSRPRRGEFDFER